jgi:hypothetical protein
VFSAPSSLNQSRAGRWCVDRPMLRESVDVIAALVTVLATVTGHECSLASMVRVSARWV